LKNKTNRNFAGGYYKHFEGNHAIMTPLQNHQLLALSSRRVCQVADSDEETKFAQIKKALNKYGFDLVEI
jgi:hypothetical protein